MTIRNPMLWGLDRLRPVTADALVRAHERLSTAPLIETTPPAVRRIDLHDVRESLRLGAADFMAGRTDVIMLCLIYPIIGLLLGRFGLGHQILPLLFPLAAGFALVGPLAGVGLNEMSRQREIGQTVTWRAAFGVLYAPSLGGIVGLGLLLTGVFLAWLAAASLIWWVTLGGVPPESVNDFATQVFATPAGWAMIALGVSVGFVFAAIVLSITVVSFPLMLDRSISLRAAIATSLRAVSRNPGAMAAWGAIVAGALVLGTLPFLIGLAVVLPILGHATWHLYRRLVRS